MILHPSGSFHDIFQIKVNLLVLDAFGNIINNVNYSDSFPWPDTDGNGYYLELLEASLDNSVAGNWIASDTILSPEDYSGISIVDYISSTGNNVFCVPDVQLFPNPVKNKLKIKAKFEMKSISLYNSLGRLL